GVGEGGGRAVGRGGRDGARAERAVGAGAVLNHHGDTERVCKLRADEPGDQIERWPGRERHHQRDWFRGPTLWAGLRRGRRRDCKDDKRKKKRVTHWNYSGGWSHCREAASRAAAGRA